LNCATIKRRDEELLQAITIEGSGIIGLFRGTCFDDSGYD
jgi:hypothetical protein